MDVGREKEKEGRSTEEKREGGDKGESKEGRQAREQERGTREGEKEEKKEGRRRRVPGKKKEEIGKR